MIRIARRVAPAAVLRVGSLLHIDLPACDAVTSIGECLNYTFDPSNRRAELRQLLLRVYRALRAGGVFTFDIAEAARGACPAAALSPFDAYATRYAAQKKCTCCAYIKLLNWSRS